ncbi:MAG: hypothetical protein RIR62_2470, partial [Pseudomonadota bacterium]
LSDGLAEVLVAGVGAEIDPADTRAVLARVTADLQAVAA